jgi:hypothetical protein
MNRPWPPRRPALGRLLRLARLVGLPGCSVVVPAALALQDALVRWGRGGQGVAGADQRDQRGHPDREREAPARGAACAPAAGGLPVHDLPPCSIVQSAWIALLPSYSQLMPYCGRFTRWRVALDTQAGEPGTVEKIESRRVVTLPSGPR